MRILLSLLATLLLAVPLLAAPNTLTQAVTYNGQTATMRLTRQDLRGPHFELWAQNSTGAYDVLTPVPERAYLGTVDEFPDAIASGIIQDDGVFRGAIYFDRGGAWYTLGSQVTSTQGLTQPTSYGLPGWTTRPGQAGTTMWGFNVGFDAEYGYYTTCGGSNLAKTFELIEYGAAITRAMYMHDALLRPYLARVIIRTDQSKDPANGTSGGGYLDAIRTEWLNNQTDAVRDLVAGISPGRVGGGLAWVGVVGTNLGFSVSDSGSSGLFGVVWRHEMGHNWGLAHYDGGAPEGSTINSNNQYARMSGPELSKALDHRNSKLNILSSEGTYTTVNIPPYASIDSGSVTNGVNGEAVIDVLANDHDANGQALSLLSFSPASFQSGTITRQGSKLIYVPRGDFVGTDSFTYKIQDSSGQTATGAVAVSVQPNDRLRLYFPLDETTGATAADKSALQRNGTLSGTTFNASTVAGKFGQALNFDGVDDDLVSSPISLNSDTVTLCAWIKRNATQSNYAGIIFDRSSSASGINIGSDGQLRYHWNGGQYNWTSGLVPPAGVWTFVALVIEPTKATMYMNSGSGFTSAVNAVSHGKYSFGAVHIGSDPTGGRVFSGAIDEPRVYGVALSQADLTQVANGSTVEAPQPFDGATNVTLTQLAWGPAPAAIRYHVYMGSSQSAVQAANPSSSDYLGQTTAATWPNPSTPNLATVQFWRVDVETASGVIPGNVWKFTRKRGGAGVAQITNPSFENGPVGTDAPVGWTRTGGTKFSMGVDPGGSQGAQHLWMTSGVLSQDLAYTITTGEKLTLKFQSRTTAPRKVELLARSGGSYTQLAETTDSTGSPAWPTITLDHTVAAANAGKQLTLRITVTGGTEVDLDNFTITTMGFGGIDTNQPPTFTTDPLVYAAGAIGAPYTGPSLAGYATDPDGNPLTFSKVSGPAWLQVAADGTLSGTPTLSDGGTNEFMVRVMDPSGARDYADLTIEIQDAQLRYDINGAAPGSGAASGGTWDGSAQWTLSPAGTTATFPWSDGATVVFSAGTDASEDYTVTNTGTRSINGFISRTGKPTITGGAIQPADAATPFIVESTSSWARINSPIIGSGGVRKDGPGVLSFGGSNTFTGNISIVEGVLELAPGGKLYNGGYNNSATITIGENGTWRMPDFSYAGMGQLADQAARRVIDGGTIEVTGDTHASGQDFTVTAKGGTFRYSAATQTLTLGGTSNSNINTAGPLTFDAVGNISVTGASAILEGAGGILKAGTGTLTLGNGGNTFTGNVTVNAGKLAVTASAVNGDSVFPASNVNSALGSRTAGRSVAINTGASMEWTVNNVLGGKNQNATYLPAIWLNGGTLKTTRYNPLGNITLTGGALINANASDPVTYDGFQFLGSVTATGEIPSSITTTTGKGNHLRGGATTEFNVADPAGLLTVATILRNGSNDYSGAASLKKTGPGTLALNAANAYTGATTVEAGTLTLGGSLASATTVKNAGTLSGTGTAGAVSVEAGGTLQPGSGATLTTGALTLATGAKVRADGRVSVNGNATLTGAEIIVSAATAPRVLLSYTGARTGQFATATVPAGWQLEYNDTAKEVRLVATAGGYDAWIATYNTGGKTGFAQDADNDGVSNGLEFLFGSDPSVAGGTALPTFERLPNGDFRFSFHRAAAARGHVAVVVQRSSDLVTWPAAQEIAIGADTASSGPGVTITPAGGYDLITVDIPGGQAKTFVRLQATPQ